MKKLLLIFNIFLLLNAIPQVRAMENTTPDISPFVLSAREIRFAILKTLIADPTIIQEDFFQSASAIKKHLKNCLKNLFLTCKTFRYTIALDHEIFRRFAKNFYQKLLLKKFLNQEKEVTEIDNKQLTYYEFKNSPFLMAPRYIEHPEEYETIINLIETFLTTINNPFKGSEFHLLIEDIIKEGLDLVNTHRVKKLWWMDLCNVLQLFYEQIFLWSNEDGKILLHYLLYFYHECFWQGGKVSQNAMKVCWHVLKEINRTYLKTRKNLPSLTELKSPKQLLEMICTEEGYVSPYWYYLVHWEQKNNCQKLLEYSIDLNQKTLNGESVFHDLISCSVMNDVEMNNFEKSPLEWLAENGADINALDAQGRTPIDYVITDQWYTENNIKALLKHKPNFKPHLYSQLILMGEEMKDEELKTLIREHPIVKDQLDQLINNCIARLRLIDRNHQVK